MFLDPRETVFFCSGGAPGTSKVAVFNFLCDFWSKLDFRSTRGGSQNPPLRLKNRKKNRPGLLAHRGRVPELDFY